MFLPRSASIKSAVVSRRVRRAFWSICPSKMTVLGRPDIRLKNFWLRKLSADPSSSKAAMRKAVVETNGSLSAALRPEKETATLADLQLKVEHSHATIPFVLDGQVLEENLHWCGKDQDWLERTAQANTLLPEEILLLVGNETEDYFLLKKESRRKGSSR